MLEGRELAILKREFRIDGQSYEMIKVMIFSYTLRKSKIFDCIFREDVYKANDYVFELVHKTNNNLELIDKYIDINLSNLLRLCICSFNPQIYLDKNFIQCLLIINKMSFEDIEYFIKHEAHFNGEKEDMSSPSGLIDLVIRLLKDKNIKSWLDLGCGSGNFLVEVSKRYRNDILFGDEISFNDVLLTNLRLHFFGSKNNIRERNILEESYGEEYDVAYSNPPLLLKTAQNIENYNSYNKYVGNLKHFQSAEWLFVDRLLQSIKDRGIVLMPEGSLFNITDIEQRKNVVEKNLVEGVIKLPSNLLTYTGISLSLVIFNKHKKNSDIKFLDATNMCKMGRRYAELNVEEILNAYNSQDRVNTVSKEIIAKQDYNLSTQKIIISENIKLDKEILLEEVVKDIFRGVQIPALEIDINSVFDENEDSCKLVSVGNIKNGTIDIDSLEEIRFKKNYERYLLKNNDLVISSKTTTIKIGIINIEDNEKVVATGSVLVVRCDENKINPIYLKTFLDSKNGKKLLKTVQTGTSIISINASAIAKMRISNIDKVHQDKIANDYLNKLNEFKEFNEKLKELENLINNVYDDYVLDNKAL